MRCALATATPALLGLALTALTGCGAAIYGDCASLGGGGVEVELPDVSELSETPRLQHYQLTALLQSHTQVETDAQGGVYRLVDYAALAEPEAARLLGDYLAVLAAVDPTQLESRDEKLAFYINAYNAWVLQGVLGRLSEDPTYRVDSDSWTLFASRYIALGGLQISPDMLEHGLVRGQEYTIDVVAAGEDPALAEALWALHDDLWGSEVVDSRAHVGFNCASMGCPNLGNEAFRGPILGEQLDALAVDFVESQTKGAGPDGVSNLFSWYRDDFTNDFGSPEDFVSAYREDTAEIRWDTTLSYDWELNGIDRW